MRTQDAVPDELEIIPDGTRSRQSSSRERGTSSDRTSIPKTVVEKVDPISPSHGDVPGTAAHSMRKADAVPDAVLQAPESDNSSDREDEHRDISPEVPVPKTVITKVDSNPSHGGVPGTEAFNLRQGDAKPDLIEKKGDVSGKSAKSHARCRPASQ